MADRNPLGQIDLRSISLDDLMKMENTAVRDVLIEMIKNPESQVASGHQNHGSHTNHNTEASRFLEQEFVKRMLKSEGGA